MDSQCNQVVAGLQAGGKKSQKKTNRKEDEGRLLFRQNSSFCPSISGHAALKPRIGASAGVFTHTLAHTEMAKL